MEQASEAPAVTLGVKVANMRTAWICLMALLLRRGLVTDEDVEGIRDQCMEAAGQFAASDCALKGEFGNACMNDLLGMFRPLLPCERTEH